MAKKLAKSGKRCKYCGCLISGEYEYLRSEVQPNACTSCHDRHTKKKASIFPTEGPYHCACAVTNNGYRDPKFDLHTKYECSNELGDVAKI